MEYKKRTATKRFDKTLTKQELDDFGYLKWDNEVLGRCVKAIAADLGDTDIKGFKSVMTMAACYLLIDTAASANAGMMKQTVEGYSSKRRPDVPLQTWEVTVKNITKK